MPRQLQLTQNLLDRAATAWNVVYSTVSFLINFPSHFEAFVSARTSATRSCWWGPCGR